MNFPHDCKFCVFFDKWTLTETPFLICCLLSMYIQQKQQHFMDFGSIANSEHLRQHRRSCMALPPTPSSLFNVKAPIRLIGGMDDWNLPSCFDDSE
ncbi:unnamed protein product [Schistosoma curassoni]|nr:unnamed protein product [Schistosoma curassoni]